MDLQQLVHSVYQSIQTLLFSAFAQYLLEESKLLDKCYLTETCIASAERNKALPLVTRWGGGAQWGQRVGNGCALTELLTCAVKASDWEGIKRNLNYFLLTLPLMLLRCASISVLFPSVFYII